jgi:agmatine/peptidylarginine deiminase
MKVRSDFNKVNHLVLPYPRGFGNEYEKLTRFFEDLIQLIPDEIHQYIIVNNKNAGEIIKLMNPTKDIDTICIDGFNEIWLRDIIGFPVGNRIVKPIFKPTYYRNVYTYEYLSELDYQTRAIIHHLTGTNAIDMPLVLDGGNLISNGDIGILTDKVLNDNNRFDNEQIRTIIREYLGIESVFMELSKNDLLGHSDGYVSFLNENVLLVSEYPNKEFLIDDINCVNKFIDQTVIKELMIKRIKDRPIDEKVNSKHNTSDDYLLSARGNYINFLNLNNTIILPQYLLTTKMDSGFYNRSNIEILKKENVEVKVLACNDLSKLGGVLRCVSLTL